MRHTVTLTLDESLPHQVIIHRLCNDLRHLVAVELDEGVAFAVSALQGNRDMNDSESDVQLLRSHLLHRCVGTWVLSPRWRAEPAIS